MANSKGPSSMKSIMYNGKNSLLPPKIPFPSISPSYLDYIPSSMLGQKGIPRSREGNSHHQRTSSESCLIEEQPLWLDELLNEPETPVRKGNHRRSSSDSFTYMDSNLDNRSKHTSTTPTWGLQDIDYYKGPYYPQLNSSVKVRNQGWDVNLNSRGVPCPRDRSMVQSAKSLSTGNENLDPIDGGSHEVQGFSERKESSHAKPSGSDSDTKRAKQQFAQRSRVRKLQYISELERNVQALQAEGSDMSAEVEFLSQQSLILSMENKALKQRLENLAQEQLIKYVEHEVLEREVARLRALYQQQQLKKKEQHQHQHQQPSSGIRRTNSRDLDQRFASLSLKHKDSNTGRDAVSGQLHI